MGNKKGRSSAWSNLVTMHVEAPVITPTEFVADSAPNGAKLTWKNFQGPVIVYRDGTNIGEGTSGQFTDPRAVLGKVYSYEIQARGDKARGRRSEPKSLTIEDRFAPAAPTGLNVVAGAGTLEISWNPNPEADILGYTVQRATAAGNFTTIANQLDAPAYTDRDVQRGTRYRYMVTALDLRKNQSVTSQEVEITVP
jgi:fibronectin type 3 domain-containing protein